MTDPASPHVVRRVDAADFTWGGDSGPAADVRRITAAADAADGVVNLNEAACLHLKHRGLSGATLHLAEQGYALRHQGNLDLVVAPDARGQGLGGALADAALAESALADSTGEVEAWSHADHPAAARVAARRGLRRTRDLWVMRRPLDDTLAVVPPGDGYRIRAFRADRPADAEGVLETNRLAFDHHPEQGHMTLADFAERQSEDWFDPAGLLLAVDAEDDTRILGFHWTKVHPDPDPVGEVYVVAVNPHAAGRGIGTALTSAGLQHLRAGGLSTVILYVDGDNDPAIAVYQGSGFTRVRVEAQYVGRVGS